MSNTAILASPADLQNVVCLFAFGTKSKFDQLIKFAKIDTTQGKVHVLDSTKFRRRGVECDAPILPHEKKIAGGPDLGPKRPILKSVANPDEELFQFILLLELTIRAGYEFAKSKLSEAFPDVITFYFRSTKLAPTRAQPNGTPAHEVIVVSKDGAMKPLSEYLPKTLNAAQAAAIGGANGISEKECINEEGVKYTTFVFANIMPKIDAKSGRLYTEMHLFHKTFPKTSDGKEGPRNYRNDKNPYRAEMSDIKQWGIEIPLLQKVEGGGYAQIAGSDWTQDPSFHAVTKDKEHNNFIGTVIFEVDSVMEGGGHVKVWWKCKVLKQPEVSARARGDDDYGEEVIEAPVGVPIALGASPARAGSTQLQGVIVDKDDDGEA